MREMYALTGGRAVIFCVIEAVVPPPIEAVVPPPAMVSLESSPARRPAVGNDERERDHHYRVVAGLRSIWLTRAQPPNLEELPNPASRSDTSDASIDRDGGSRQPTPNPPINAPNGVRNNHGIGLPQHRFSRIAYRLAEFVAGAVFFINTFAAAYRHAMQGSSAIFSPYHRGGGDTTQGQFHANEPIGYGDETFLMTNTTCVLFVRLLCCSPPPNSCFCTIFFVGP